MSQSLMKRAGSNVIWSAIEGFSVQFVQFLISVIIARIISPAEFGLIAMLTIFLSVAQVFVDSGFSNALIQKQDRKEIDYLTVFYFNIFFSICTYFFLFFIAPFVARFYDQSVLEVILKCIGLNVIIASFSIVQRAKLVIKGDFKTLAKSSLLAAILSGGIGIYYAYTGLGVWALVIQSISNQLFASVLLWLHSKWLPKLAFSVVSFKSLFAFGSKILFSGLINVIYVNAYTLIIGKRYSLSDVGYYSRSNMFAQFPSVSLTGFIVRAIYPVQCEYQEDDDRFLMMIYRYIKLSTFIIFPVMIALCVVAKPLIYVLLTEKWDASVELLMILSIAYMWRPIMGINEVLNAKGRSDLFLQSEVTKKIIALILLVISFPLGVKYMCYSLLLYSFFDMFIIIYYVKKIVRIKYSRIAKCIMPTLLLGLFVGGLMYIPQFFFLSSLLQLCLGLIIGSVLYLIIAKMFRFQEIEDIITVLKSFINKNITV